MRVLLAIDSSGTSQNVIYQALSRPWQPGSKFYVLNVVDQSHREKTAPPQDDANDAAHVMVKSAREQLVRGGLAADSGVQSGVPKNAISDFAKTWEADLVMIGANGQGGWRQALLGSIAQAVLRTAPCSVEIVRPTSAARAAASPALKILLATDGSEFAVKAEHSVAGRPWPAGSQVRIVSAVHLFTPGAQVVSPTFYAAYPDMLVDEVWNQARTRAEEAVAEARGILASGGLSIDAGNATPTGEPRDVLLNVAAAWEANLIVLGSHGGHGFDHLLMGSVSEWVALHAQCSVEVIRG
ncbi:MAG: universal stress protein [Terriglobales bacterium]